MKKKEFTVWVLRRKDGSIVGKQAFPGKPDVPAIFDLRYQAKYVTAHDAYGTMRNLTGAKPEKATLVIADAKVKRAL